MTTLMVPKDEIRYPSLGRQVVAWIEENLVYGPGDLRGQPVQLDQEKRALVYRMYEVYPEDHPLAGRRRFKRAGISLRKGSAKTEFAAMIAAVELHPDGPVRCDGFDANGEPVGFGVTNPYIPMVAYTEEQSDELAYSCLMTILQYSQVVDDFDIGLERIMRINGDGKAVSLASSPDSRDGALTTFQVCDETHRWNMRRLKDAHKTMLANTVKRYIADSWTLEVTTAYSPGENSVAEDTMEYAKKVAEGKISDPKLFFFHRQASEDSDLTNPEGIRKAVLEASGPIAAWSDIDGICKMFEDPTMDKSYLQRVWLNQIVRGSEKAFDYNKWKSLGVKDNVVSPGSFITLGFDGARWHDSVALVGTDIKTGFQWLLGLWQKPQMSGDVPNTADEWEAPEEEISGVVDAAFNQYSVWRMYCDPPYWEAQVAAWAGKYGEKRVIAWYTARLKQMAYSIQTFNNSMRADEITHSGDERYSQHIANAIRKNLNMVDEKGDPLWVIYKERADSPNKIDAAMAGILSWQARCDAVTAGVTGEPQESIYEKRGVITI
jgi:phage terminase large subunit-like protein